MEAATQDTSDFISSLISDTIVVFYTLSKMSYQLLAMENPLLDIQVHANEELLKKYDLLANNAILAEEKHKPLYTEIVKDYEVVYVAGGASQNTARGAQYLLPPNSTIYLGAVSDDHFADQMKKAAARDGLRTEYQIVKEVPTGTCAVLVTGHHRSLVANLSAAEKFTLEYLLTPSVWKHVENAKYFYIGGFFLTHSGGAAATIEVAKHASTTDKVFALNLSAPFISQVFKNQLDAVLPYVDILFGNEDEARTYASTSGWETTDLKEIALRVANSPKINAARARVVVITHGAQDTIVGLAATQTVKTYPIIKIAEKDIVDTNGAGDAFVGGFLGLYVQGVENIERCVAAGHWLANIVIQRVGPTYPEERKPFVEA
ncbi:Ribokinase-like protein [Jimgerdemannia flammicorona]|uniref:Ribokinase-like protein n=2 Tax=Jimgerdemannia flammicorona TaxID=994334 RepID=A0A433DAL9_9FUNG|nr:Ribokinase-like protein [Jimgerdemannia flammicorona]RUS25461.1 Ribokinase-like protein [Jimgerdemannia flammicorona]